MNGGAGTAVIQMLTNAEQRDYLLTDTVITALHRAQFDVSDVLRRAQGDVVGAALIERATNSSLGGRQGISLSRYDVRYGSEADIAACPRNVCFTPKSGHRQVRWRSTVLHQ